MENNGKLLNSTKDFENDPDFVECMYVVLNDGKESEWLKVKTGLKQGSVISGFMFMIEVDWIMKRVTAENITGIYITCIWNFMSKLENLDCADGLALLLPVSTCTLNQR